MGGAGEEPLPLYGLPDDWPGERRRRSHGGLRRRDALDIWSGSHRVAGSDGAIVVFCQRRAIHGGPVAGSPLVTGPEHLIRFDAAFEDMLTADEDELAALRRTSGRPAMDRLVYELDEAAQRIGHALGVLVPSDEDRPVVHRIIYEELCLGVINDESRRVYLAAIADLVERGADGIVLGCTEIGLLVGPGDADVPIFDRARVHAQRAVELALQEG